MADELKHSEKNVVCPNCGSMRCFESSTEPKTEESYLCIQCGFMSHSKYLENSEVLNNQLTQSADIIGSVKLYDKERDIVWLPSVLNMGDRGIIYPEGTDSSNWHWKFAKTKTLKEDEQKDYPVPNKEGEFYKSILDVKNARTYDKLDFMSACKDMGIIMEKPRSDEEQTNLEASKNGI